MRRAAWIALLGIGGCTLLDLRSELSIEPPGTLYAGDALELRVRADGARRARVLVDGDDVGEIDVNATVMLNVESVSLGRHRLSVRLVGAPYPTVSEERELWIDRAGPGVQAAFEPAGLPSAAYPFAVVLQASEPIRASDVDVVVVTDAGNAPVSAVVTVEGDRTVRIALPPLYETGNIRLEASLSDRALNRAHHQLLVWISPIPVEVRMPRPFELFYARDVMFVALDVLRPVRAPIVLEAVDELGVVRPLTTIPDGVPVSRYVDTSALPEGLHRLRVSAHGWTPNELSTFVVDHTPRGVLRCDATEDVRVPVRVHVEEWGAVWTGNVDVTVTSGGSTFRPYVRPGFGYFDVDYVIGTPGEATITLLPGLADAAGNVMTTPWSCTLAYPGWKRARDGVGTEIPLPSGATGLGLAASVYSGAALAWIHGPASTTPGRAAVARIGYGARWQEQTLGSEGAKASEVALSASGEKVYWIEHELGGATLVREEGEAEPLNLEPSGDARSLSPDHDRVGRVAWSELGSAGNRVVVVGGGGFTSVVPVAPNGSADSPSLGEFLAYVESVGGGPHQLRARYWDGLAWQPLEGPESLNEDPGVEATEPQLAPSGRNILAWEEGGRVLVRHRIPSGAAYAWTAPEPAGDPGRRSRSPRFSGGTLVFVEDTPAGEVLVMKVWDGSSWVDEPPIEGFEPTDIRAVTVSLLDLAVAWQDAAGAVEVRVRNR